MRLPLDCIRLDGGTQQRTSINEAAVSDYAEIYMAGGTLPDPVVFFDGAEYFLAAGFHRYHAARRAALHDLVFDMRQGTRREAVLFATGDNATHGLRRSADDKRKAVRTMLEDEEWGQWSDREIARHCSVTHPFVAKLREELKPAHLETLPDSPAAAPAAQETRTVKRGEQVYQQKVEKAAPAAKPEKPAPAAKPNKPAAKDAGPDPEAEARMAELLELAQEAQQQAEELTAQVKAMEADDQKAETLKYVRMYEHAKREQSAAMDRAAASQEREAWTKRQLMRCGKAVGELDPTQIAAKVEAMARERQAPAGGKTGKVAA